VGQDSNPDVDFKRQDWNPDPRFDTDSTPGDPLMRYTLFTTARLGLLSSCLIVSLFSQAVHADDWPQWLGPKRDGVWRETGILDKFPPEGPKVRWRTPVGMGYSGPAVAAGRVYVTDRLLTMGAKNPDSPFDDKHTIQGNERILCLDEKTGEVLWTHAYDCPYRVSYAAGPRATPVVHDGKVYTLGTMGDLLCLDAGSGKVLWSKNFVKDYGAPVPQWGFSSSPLLDGDRLICLVGGKGSVAVALHKDTGKEIWKALSASQLGYCPPVIYEAGGKRQLIIWHGDSLNSLNPETGELYWSQKFKDKAAMTIATPRKDGDRLFVSSFYGGSMMLKLDPDKPAASVVWRRQGRDILPDQTESLHTVISTPVLKDGHIYGVCSHGELRCLSQQTGDRIWESMRATSNNGPVRWGNVFFIAQGDRYFLANERGELIIARLTPKGYEEISRAKIVEPTNTMASFGIGREKSRVVWSHPAFANKCIYARNDKEIVCVSLAAE
jgi:outer membrane protein assembly factor BamB